MDRAFQRIRSLMLRGTFYSVPPIYKASISQIYIIISDPRKRKSYFRSASSVFILKTRNTINNDKNGHSALSTPHRERRTNHFGGKKELPSPHLTDSKGDIVTEEKK